MDFTCQSGRRLNPDLEYASCNAKQERLVVAEALLKDTMLRYEINNYHVIGYCKVQPGNISCCNILL